jgi:antitoxin CptB
MTGAAFMGASPDTDIVDAAGLNRLKWRCRRGMLENDLLIERFFRRHEATLTHGQAQGLLELMDLGDNDLLDLVLGRKEPEGHLAQGEPLEVLGLLRQPNI